MQPTLHKNASDPGQKRPTFPEKIVSRSLLGLIVLIAVALLWVQSRFDPARWRAQPEDAVETAGAADHSAPALPVEGLQVMTPTETYDAATLSDKIDGKAELYLSAGFVQMQSNRFALAANPTLWMERFVYDMDSYANAFAVFSRQRRDGAAPLDLTADAYRSANGIFLVQGGYYLEIIGSDTAEVLIDKMMAVARAFVAAHPVASAQTDERSLFPETDLVAGTVTLTPTNAFGFDRFDHVYTAEYRWGDATATAFISRRSSPAEAAELAAAYAAFLITYGGEEREASTRSVPVLMVEILDQYELVFSRGEFLAGIHEVSDPAKGAALAERMYTSLGKGTAAE